MSQINDYKSSVSDVSSHDIIDNTSASHISHVDKIIADTISHRRLNYSLNKGIKNLIIELKCNEAILSCDLTSFLVFVALPTVQSKVDIH